MLINCFLEVCQRTGTSCSKLTMLLVNDSLKFQMAILQINYYFFLLKKCENPLHCKGFSHFYAPQLLCPNFEEVEGAYWFGSVRAVQCSLSVSQSVCDA